MDYNMSTFCQKCQKSFYSMQTKRKHDERYHPNDSTEKLQKHETKNSTQGFGSSAAIINGEQSDESTNDEGGSDNNEGDESASEDSEHETDENSEHETDDEVDSTLFDIIKCAIEKRSDIDTEAWNKCVEYVEQVIQDSCGSEQPDELLKQ